MRSWGRLVAGPLPVAIAASVLALAILGCGSSASSDESGPEQEALSRYQDYLSENLAQLSQRVAKLQKEIIKDADFDDEVAGSESAYTLARVPYGHIDPAARLYPPLARRIDGLEEDVPPDEFAGFHEIEKWLFWEDITGNLKPFAKQLVADVEELRKRIDSAELRPDQIVAGANEVAVGLVEDVFPGNAERWSYLSLVDAAAKAEGIDAAFKAVKPRLEEANPELTRQIQAQLEAGIEKVGEYGTLARDSDPSEPERAGTSFIVYDQVIQKNRWDLAESFKPLVELLSQAEDELSS